MCWSQRRKEIVIEPSCECIASHLADRCMRLCKKGHLITLKYDDGMYIRINTPCVLLFACEMVANQFNARREMGSDSDADNQSDLDEEYENGCDESGGEEYSFEVTHTCTVMPPPSRTMVTTPR
jgi:hypothetical protein